MISLLWKIYAQESMLRSMLQSRLIIAVGLVCVVAFVLWFVLLYRLISFLPHKYTLQKVLLWAFLVPALNLLWIPWALLETNELVSRINERYTRLNVFHPSVGMKILSVPLLMLYLLWLGVGVALMNGLLSGADTPEMFILSSIVLVCMLIVLMPYLVHLSVFNARIKDYYRHLKKQSSIQERT